MNISTLGRNAWFSCRTLVSLALQHGRQGQRVPSQMVCFSLFERFKRFSQYFKSSFFLKLSLFLGAQAQFSHRSSYFLALQLGGQGQRVSDMRFCSRTYMVLAFCLSYSDFPLKNHQFWPKSLAGKPKSCQIFDLLILLKKLHCFFELVSSKMFELSSRNSQILVKPSGFPQGNQ